MDRRNFFKIVGTASGGLIAGACGKEARQIVPLLVPEQEMIPGTEQWHPGVCRECAAGCGIILRVMEAEHEIERNGERVRERIAAIKKVEGNPLDPVGGGRLCARGQAAVQSVYHPDRLRGPQRRNGPRGRGAFEPISWDKALDEAAAVLEKAVAEDPQRIVFLSRSQAGSRSATITSFLRALGAPPASTIGFCDFTIERRAAQVAFGWDGLPVYDIQNAGCILSLGADFLGSWASPVFYARGFGHMRQGRTGKRGRLIHAESRFSLTAGNADEWLPVRPGGEHALALAIGHILVSEKLAKPSGVSTAGLRDSFASVHFEQAAEICGLPLDRIREAAHTLAASEAPVVMAGASVVQTNSLDAVVAGNALNWLLGSVGRKGGVLPPPREPAAGLTSGLPSYDDLQARLEVAELVVLDGSNPVYTLPFATDRLAKAPSIISFSPFVDDSSAYADLILPDHAPLESSEVVAPCVSPVAALVGSRSPVRPLHDTCATGGLLAKLAGRLGHPIETETPESAFKKLFSERRLAGEWTSGEEFSEYQQRQGGWWAEPREKSAASPAVSLSALREPDFSGPAAKYPLHFQPYPSVQFGDGSSAQLPWMQELPDPVSSAMWGLPVEVDPKTAARTGLHNGDFVRVISPHGELQGPVYVNPAAIPGVVSMAVGQGHTHYGRYASGRGANPLAIAAPVPERSTGVFAFGATRVRIERLGRLGAFVQFSTMDREPEIQRR